MRSNKIVYKGIYLLFLYNYVNLSICGEDHNDITSCRIPTSQREVNEFQPLLLQSRPYPPKFLYPRIDSPGMIETTSVRLVCPEGDDSLAVNFHRLNARSALLECSHRRNDYRITRFQLFDDQLHDNRRSSGCRCNVTLGEAASFSEIGCVRQQLPEARLLVSTRRSPFPRACSQRASIRCVEIGFQLNHDDFLPTIEYIAVDARTLQPLVAHARLVPVIGHRHRGRGSWTPGRGPIFKDLDRVRLMEVYRREYQRRRFLEIFEDVQLANMYVPEIGDNYLTEAQLISERDFFFRSQQASASFHENTVPVWRGVAAGNWELAGEIVREIAAETLHEDALYVWSGAIGVLELPDYRGGTRRIYLTVGRYGQSLIPVPKLLFKFVYDGRRHRGLALLTVNDPRLLITDRDQSQPKPLCRPRPSCHRLHPRLARPERGFTYCCSPDDFVDLVRELGLPVFPGAESII